MVMASKEALLRAALERAWARRKELYTKASGLQEKANEIRLTGSKLSIDGDKLHAKSSVGAAEGNKCVGKASRTRYETEVSLLYAKSHVMYAKADKIWAECRRLEAEAEKQWCDAILNVYGNVTINWQRAGSECLLEIVKTEIFK